MKHKLLEVLVLLLAGISFAQTGMMGGSDGIHQQNTKTLGQWNFTLGTGGNVSLDPWSLTRGGIFYEDGQRTKMQDVKLSATGNFFFALGFSDAVDAGIAAEINYDRTNAQDIDEATSSIRPGDMDFWIKARAPFVNKESVFGLAAQLDVFMPTGEKTTGTRPRHAWYIKGREDTNPFTADEVVVGATLIASVDLTKISVPLRWNAAVGFMYANLCANTLVYSTGFNWDWSYWITAFVEYSGEFRVENNGLPIDFFEDPMFVTPGIRLHLPQNFELVGGIDLSTRMMRVGYNRKKEMKDIDKYTIGYVDENGVNKRYGYTPGVNYALTGSLTWTFGGESRSYKPAAEQNQPVIDTVHLARTDTVVKVDTIVHADTVIKVDTIIKLESFVIVDSMPDADSDGVSDDVDLCPNSPPKIVVNRNGCPRDFDGDGIPDYLDLCPNTLAGTAVDSSGCAVDEDLDGVADSHDKCPNTPKNSPVDSTGCPADVDKDGIPDFMDQCADTWHNMAVDKNGCPANKRENIDLLKKGISFKGNSATLAKTSFKALDDVYALLYKYREIGLEFQCHMDSVGKGDASQILSQSRAQAAVDYLLKKGVPASHLRAVGYGKNKPAETKSKKKKSAQVCRVELVPFSITSEKQNVKEEKKPEDGKKSN